jgi:hypothetical protein
VRKRNPFGRQKQRMQMISHIEISKENKYKHFYIVQYLKLQADVDTR